MSPNGQQVELLKCCKVALNYQIHTEIANDLNRNSNLRMCKILGSTCVRGITCLPIETFYIHFTKGIMAQSMLHDLFVYWFLSQEHYNNCRFGKRKQ